MNYFKNNLPFITILILIGVGVYAFNLNNPLFWDDTDWIVNNPFVHSFSLENVKNWFTQNILAGISQSSNYYRPFLLFTFTLNYVFGGDSPFGYHLLSNALHVSNAILIFLLLFSVFKNKFISFWESLIWLVHPLQTEAVTYISGRGDPLNVFFMLLILWLFIKNQNRSFSTFHFLLSTFFLILALLSRETAVIFPFLFMVFYISFVSREKFLRSVRTAFVKAIPYFSVVFVYGILRLTVLNFENTLNFYSQTNPYTESLLARMYTFLNVLWTYTGLMIVPLGQHMERSVTIYTYFWNWPVLSSFLVLLAVLAVLRYLYKKENQINIQNSKQSWKLPDLRSRSGSFGGVSKIENWKFSKISDFRVWFFGVGWFFVNLSMTSGITPINAQLYQHWLYLALLGPLVLVIYYLHRIFEKFGKKSVRALIILFLISVSVFFSILSVKRNIIWGKPIEFFEDILKYEPGSARINNNLGYLYYDEGDKDKAAEYYSKAIETTGNSFPQPYFNLGTILQEKGDIRGAIVMFEKAIELDPNFAYPYPNLAVIYASQGDLVKATNYQEKLKELVPHLQRVYYNLALTYIKRGDYESAYLNLQDGLKYGQFDPETEPLIKDLLNQLER